MALGAVLAAALTDHSAHPFGLWLNGVDLNRNPNSTSQKYGALLETIEVYEAPPGGVSSMSFTLEDPTSQVSIPTPGSDWVSMWDLADDHPEFLGLVDSVAVRPHPGTLGRFLDIQCKGIESLLDDITLTGSLDGGSQFMPQFMALVAAMQTPLRALMAPTPPSNGVVATPLANIAVVFSATRLFSDMPARELFGSWTQSGVYPIRVTVDFYGGLRFYSEKINNGLPDDYATLTINDAVAGPIVAENLSYRRENEIIRRVIINGANARYEVPDGSGRAGKTATLNYSWVTDAAGAQDVGLAYMQDRATAVRGSFELNNWSHGANNYRAGGYVVITDAMVGLSATQFKLGGIRKRYHGDGDEDWVVEFGGSGPSVARLFQQLMAN